MKLAILTFLTAALSFLQQKPWRQLLDERLPYLGQGNWIVIADSAFPFQPTPGIETILSNESQIETVRQVLTALSKDGHLRPVVYIDRELKYVAEQDAAEVSAYRQLLSGVFEKLYQSPVSDTLTQQAILRSLGEASKAFTVLVIKTNSVLPYSSVFIELKPGHWTDDAEQRLRQSIP
jgi:hypothetical protein